MPLQHQPIENDGYGLKVIGGRDKPSFYRFDVRRPPALSDYFVPFLHGKQHLAMERYGYDQRAVMRW